MYSSLLRISAAFLLITLSASELSAQKRNRKRTTHSRSTTHSSTSIKHRQSNTVDISKPEPPAVPIPQEKSLKPELKKTKKVTIVPAPPPPPGHDPVPPYPKR